jgi:membrane-associated protein
MDGHATCVHGDTLAPSAPLRADWCGGGRWEDGGHKHQVPVRPRACNAGGAVRTSPPARVDYRDANVFDWLVDHVSGSPWTYLILAVASGGDVVLPLIPSETIVITSGILVADGALHWWLVIPCAAIGAIIGDNIVFLLGARVGEPVAQRLFRHERGRRRLRRAERGVSRHATVMIVVGRFIPGGRTASTFAAGTLELPWRRFIVADVIAAGAWAAYVTLLGVIGGRAFRDSILEPLALSLGIALVVAVVLEVVRRVQRRRGKDLPGEGLDGEDEERQDRRAQRASSPR